MDKRKQLKIEGKCGDEIDFNVLRTFNSDEWKEWINARMSGRDPYGFGIGGTHARIEPSDYFAEIWDKINEGEAFPEAEKAIEEILTGERYKEVHSGYEQAEIFSITRSITKPNRGYPLITERVTKLFREGEYKKATDIFRGALVKESLGLLGHMQLFEDKQFRDIYSDFLRERKDIDRNNNLIVYRNAFLGLQVSYNFHRVDEEALKKILELDRGHEQELEVVFRCLGKVLKDKSDFYFNGLREKERQREALK